MKIPFVIISRNGKVDTIHQSTATTKSIDFFDYISINLAGEPPECCPTPAAIAKAVKDRTFQHEGLVIQLMEVDVKVP